MPNFSEVQAGPVDPMFVLKRDYESDTDPKKIDLGIGVLRDEKGKTFELPAIQKGSGLSQYRLIDR